MSPHLSVLLPEVIKVISPLAGKCVVDGTFGAGGYTRAFLEQGAQVMAFDRDIRVRPHADAVSADHPGRFRWINRRFSEMADGLTEVGVTQVDAIVLDIGVSSMQLDEAERGFSFMRDGPLDMRMGTEGRTAADIVNEDSAEEIARVLWLYGEERKSRLIAAAIVRRRSEQPFTRTLDLAEVIEKALGGRRGAPTHPATRSFQGLRIAVNDEMGELEQAIEAAEGLLNPGGVLAIVTFQSLEDRLVKSAFNTLSGRMPSASRHLPEVRRDTPRFEALTPGGIAPSEAEIAANPRARSARLRAIRKRSHS